MFSCGLLNSHFLSPSSTSCLAVSHKPGSYSLEIQQINNTRLTRVLLLIPPGFCQFAVIIHASLQVDGWENYQDVNMKSPPLMFSSTNCLSAVSQVTMKTSHLQQVSEPLLLQSKQVYTHLGSVQLCVSGSSAQPCYTYKLRSEAAPSQSRTSPRLQNHFPNTSNDQFLEKKSF